MLSTARWLCRYQSWATARLVEAAALLPDDDFRRSRVIAGGHIDGSLFETLAHVVASDALWLARWRGDPEARLRSGRDYGDAVAIAAACANLERDRSRWLDTIDEDDLDAPVRYVSVTRHVREAFPLRQTLLHSVTHGAHHRSEACVALTALGSPPPGVDLIDFMRGGG